MAPQGEVSSQKVDAVAKLLPTLCPGELRRLLRLAGRELAVKQRAEARGRKFRPSGPASKTKQVGPWAVAAAAAAEARRRGLGHDASSSHGSEGSHHRRGGKRFWDKQLELDWSATGLPRLAFPPGHGRALRDDEVLGLLSGMAKEPMAVDWEAFELLRPLPKLAAPTSNLGVDWSVLRLMSPKAVDSAPEPAFVDEEDFVEPLIIDWSCNRLPRQDGQCGPRRRPGPFAPRRRHVLLRKLESRSHRQAGVAAPAPEQEETNANNKVLVAKLAPTRRSAAAPPPRVPSAALRTAPKPRIQQPCGGGR